MPLTLHIDSEDHELLLLALRDKRRTKLDRLMELREEAQMLAIEVREYDAKIARYSAVPSSISAATEGAPLTPTNPPTVTNAGRVKRGESRNLIAAKLSELNGTGATTWDLVNTTGTKYSTVRRVLLELQRDKLAVERSGKWHFCHAITQPSELDDLWGGESNGKEAATGNP